MKVILSVIGGLVVTAAVAYLTLYAFGSWFFSQIH